MVQDAFSWQVQIGSHRYADAPIVGAAESWYRLTQAAGIASGQGEISVTPNAYLNGAAIFGIDFEKIGDAAFTGVNTQGQVMSLVCTNAWPAVSASPKHIYC